MRGRPINGVITTRTPKSHIVIRCAAKEEKGADNEIIQRFSSAVLKYWRQERGKVTVDDDAICSTPGAVIETVQGWLEMGTTTWIWLHNASRDLTLINFWDVWDKGQFRSEWHVLDDNCLILSGTLDTCQVRIVDVRNWLPHGIEKLSEWTEIPTEPVSTIGSADTIALLRADREACVLAMTARKIVETVRELDLGSMRYTASSQAFRHWQRMGPAEQVVPSANASECKLARDSYYSGRTELFRIGKVAGPIYVLDANGMYAAAMTHSLQPRKLIDYTDTPKLSDLLRQRDNVGVIADVLIESEEQYPYRLNDVGVVYPVGRYWTCLAGPELDYALTAGHVLDCRRAASYKLGKVCNDFARFWWEARCKYRAEGDEVLAALAKAMPCYLYGRWGQTARLWEEVGSDSATDRFCVYQHYDHSTKLCHPGRVIAGISEVDFGHVYRVQRQQDNLVTVCRRNWKYSLETPYSFPALASWITSQARRIMDTYRATAGVGNVYYQCHDALHVNEEGVANLRKAGHVIEGALGKLKVKACYGEVEYYGINLLRVDGQLVAAGLPSLHKVAADGSVTATTFEGMAGVLRRQIDGTVRAHTHEWRMLQEYRHGVPLESGAVAPLRLSS